MNYLASVIGWTVLAAMALIAAYVVFDFLANRITYAWCLTHGAYNLKAYRNNWSRPRRFLWALHLKPTPGKLYMDSGKQLLHWDGWRIWGYAARSDQPAQQEQQT